MCTSTASAEGLFRYVCDTTSGKSVTCVFHCTVQIKQLLGSSVIYRYFLETKTGRLGGEGVWCLFVSEIISIVDLCTCTVVNGVCTICARCICTDTIVT